MNRKLLYIIILSIILSSCGSGNETERMYARVASLMNEHPDSALILLQGIDPGSISQKKRKAKYALFLSQALDKNYYNNTDFAVLQPAIDYYEKHGTVSDRFLALYYQGRIQFNRGEYAQAMLSYAQAENLLPDMSDNYALGLLYAQKGIIYEKLYDYPRSLAAYQKAFHFYQSAGKTSHLFYTKLDIGQLSFHMKQYEDAERNLMEVLHWAYDNRNVSICRACIGMLNKLYEEIGDYEALQQLNEGGYAEFIRDELVVLCSKAYVHALHQETENAREWLDSAWRAAKTQQDTINLFFKEYQINKKTGQYEQALEYHEKVFRIQDSIVRHTLQQPIWSAQKDYFQSQSDYNALKLKHSRENQIFVGVTILILISLAFVLIRQVIVAKNKELVHYMDYAGHLKQSLFEKNKDVKEIGEEVAQMNEQINRLFVAQFTTIDKLSNTYYETHHTQRGKEAMYHAVKKEIEAFSTKEAIQRLEGIVNMYRKDIMKKVRESMSHFSEMDFRLLCFIYAGFSAKAISIFTGDSVGNIYTKKSRLKTKIMESDTVHKDEMIYFM